LHRWRERFPGTGYEAVSEALSQLSPAYGIPRPLGYLSPKPVPSREYLEISYRGKLLEEIDRELLQREDDQRITSTSRPKKAAAGQSQPMTEPPSNRARVNGYIDEVQRVNRRLTATIQSPPAAKRMEAYLKSKAIGQTEFATQVGTTDRTLRAFRKTGKVRRDIFEAIAKAMGMDKEALLNAP
jgi:hypothetical protein